MLAGDLGDDIVFGDGAKIDACGLMAKAAAVAAAPWRNSRRLTSEIDLGSIRHRG
jgi:hypothetical protein